MIIDATREEALNRYREALDDLIYEKKHLDSYDASDICLVRVTDHLPNDRFLPSLCNIPFLIKSNSLVHDVVMDMLAEREGNPDSYSTRSKVAPLAKEFDYYSTQYRSSIHFCLNGVVGNHLTGTFDGSIVIVEPFKYHDKDENLLAVRGEDTYFKDGIKLSDEATVLIPIEMQDKIGDVPYNVVYYKGDRRTALNMYLVSNGIVPETVLDSYLEESATSRLINKFIGDHNYCRERHCYHPTYKEDDQKSVKLWDHYAHMFYDYLFEEAYHDESIRREEREILHGETSFYAATRESENYVALKNVIEDIGLDRFKEIVTGFNNMMEEKLRNGEIPSNNKLLGIDPVITSDSNSVGGKK